MCIRDRTNGVWACSEKLRALLDAIDSPNVAALWDVNHPFRYYCESAQTDVYKRQGYGISTARCC